MPEGNRASEPGYRERYNLMSSIELVALTAAVISILVYLGLGFQIARKMEVLGDHLPITTGRLARVENSKEFSASTVATTISLVTVIMAFFELAPYFGPWLLWTVITTVLGLIVVHLFIKKIAMKMLDYGDYRPTLHAFLGLEYRSPLVALIGAACTSLGFLGAFSVELTVGSRFLSHLIPSIPLSIVIIVLAVVSFVYTSAGGFRAVIVTDRIQMKAVWLLLAALLIFYIIHVFIIGGITVSSNRIPSNMKGLSGRDGLLPFIVGIFIINVPTYLSDMSMWQRIAGSQDSQSLMRGLFRSAIGAAITWSLLILFACLVPIVVVIPEDENPLLTLIRTIASQYNIWGLLILFLVTLGLYGAMFSTASTQLIVVAHTIYSDILRKSQELSSLEAFDSDQGIWLSRVIISTSAIVAMAIVEILSSAGFSIADFVFAIYGSQLGLFPPTFLALWWKPNQLKHLGNWALAAIILGFVTGWGTAGYGKFTGTPHLVFLAPAASLFTSSLLMGLGILRTRIWDKSSKERKTYN